MNLLTLQEAALLTGLSATSLRRLCAEGKIRGAVKKGRVWLVPEASVLKVERRRVPKGGRAVTETKEGNDRG